MAGLRKLLRSPRRCNLFIVFEFSNTCFGVECRNTHEVKLVNIQEPGLWASKYSGCICVDFSNVGAVECFSV